MTLHQGEQEGQGPDQRLGFASIVNTSAQGNLANHISADAAILSKSSDLVWSWSIFHGRAHLCSLPRHQGLLLKAQLPAQKPIGRPALTLTGRRARSTRSHSFAGSWQRRARLRATDDMTRHSTLSETGHMVVVRGKRALRLLGLTLAVAHLVLSCTGVTASFPVLLPNYVCCLHHRR